MIDSRRVLVVENDRFLGAHVRQALESVGFVVDVAESGREAVALARQTRPAVASVNLWLPDLDGIAVAAALQSAHGTNLPVVILNASARDISRAQRLGTFTYLAKAFTVAALVAAVQGALGPATPT